MSHTRKGGWNICTPPVKARILELWASGMRIRHIANELGIINDCCVRQIVKRAGFDPKARFAKINKRPKVEAMLRAGKSQEEIAKKLDVTRRYVCILLRGLEAAQQHNLAASKEVKP